MKGLGDGFVVSKFDNYLNSFTPQFTFTDPLKDDFYYRLKDSSLKFSNLEQDEYELPWVSQVTDFQPDIARIVKEPKSFSNKELNRLSDNVTVSNLPDDSKIKLLSILNNYKD